MTSKNVVVNIFSLPSEVLQMCIASYLKKSEQYQFFALSKSWKSLLMLCRTILLTPICSNYELATFDHNCIPRKCRWKLFRDSEEHRRKFFEIVNVTIPDMLQKISDNQPIRKFRVFLHYKEAVKCRKLLSKYAEYFYQIELRFPSQIVDNPTAESINRLLISASELNSTVSSAIQTNSVITKSSENEREFSNSELVDLSPFKGLHRIELDKCQNIIDISMLSDVKHLIVSSCPSITVFPSPSGRFQEWSFASIPINNLNISKLKGLYYLKLSSCVIDKELSGFQNIANVELLHLTNKKLSHLTNIGNLRIWFCSYLDSIFDLSNVKEMVISDCSYLYCLNVAGCNLKELRLFNCPIRSLELINVYNTLRVLVIYNCQQLHNIDIDWIQNVEMDIADCPSINLIAPSNQSPRPLTVNRKGIEFDNFKLRTAVQLWHCRESFALAIYGHISFWNVSKVTNMDYLFRYHNHFNSDLSDWDVSNVVSMEGIFYGASAFNKPLQTWDVSNVQNMKMAFIYAASFNQAIGTWNVNNVRIMNEMFSNATSFNQPLNLRDTKSAISMHWMFHNAKIFNQPLNSWNVSNVSNMSFMFSRATAFNQPLESWDVSNVVFMENMFNSAKLFNQPLNSWSVSNVNSFYCIFYEATAFNQPLDQWKVKNAGYRQ